ncbi:MAG: hypothetical protein DRJ38_01970 [Thermoprotei archaeon]|nr:MAG: hypothetical protein DRJ38_01970 [Thermoprotei archaeon]
MKKAVLAYLLAFLLVALALPSGVSAFELTKPPSDVLNPPTSPPQTLIINGYRVPVGAVIDYSTETITLPDGTTCKLSQLTPAGCPTAASNNVLDPAILPTSLLAVILVTTIIVAKKRKPSRKRMSTAMIAIAFTSLLLAAQYLPSASAVTPPLDTSQIGIMAWEKVADYIQLNKTLSIYESFTWGGNYIDGKVIIADGKNNAYEPGSDDSVYGYIKVDVRVRADGYVIAYLKRASAGGYTTGGRCSLLWTSFRDGDSGGTTLANGTVLSQAIYVVAKIAGLSPDQQTIFNQAKYYDFEYPEAKRLIIFGKWGGGNPSRFYFTPIDVKVIKAYTSGEGSFTHDQDYCIDSHCLTSGEPDDTWTDKPHNEYWKKVACWDITNTITWTNNTAHVFKFDGSSDYRKVWVIMLLAG